MKNVWYILRLTVTLLLICALVAGVLAGVNAITKERIAAAKQQKTLDAIAEVLPGVEGLKKIELTGNTGIVTEVYASDDNYAVMVAPAGFGDKITLMVGVADDEVTGVQVVSHAETPGLGAIAAANNAKGEAFRDQFAGTSGELVVGEDIDAITGATITSKAVTEGVNAALAYVKKLG